MEVQVKLFATIAQYAPDQQSAKPFVVEVEQGATVGDLIDQLGIPHESVHLRFVKGRAQSINYLLQSGDEVGFFPPVGGG